MSQNPDTNQKTKKQIMEEEIKERKQRKNSYQEELKTIYAITSPKEINLPIKKNDQDNSIIDLDLDGEDAKQESASCRTTKPVFMAICGGSGSGKTFISKWIMRHFENTDISVCMLKEKNFLKNLEISENIDRESFLKSYDFDNPDAVDWELFEKAASTLEQRKPFNTPIYDLFSSKRILKTKKLESRDIVIVEGRLILHNKYLRDLCNVRVFLETDVDIMLSRRVFKGLARNLDLNFIIDGYLKYVKPNYETYIETSKVYADLVVHNFGGLNFSIEQFENNYEIIGILQDLLKFRLNGKNQDPPKQTEDSVIQS